jgi:hypothetical protein
MEPYLSTIALSRTSQPFNPCDLGVDRMIKQITVFL